MTIKKGGLTLVASVCCIVLSFGQIKIAASAGLGGSKLTSDLGKDGSIGLAWLLDAKYFINDKIAVGLEYNRSGLVFAKDDALFGVATYGNTMVMAKGEYFFTDTKFKPYAGLALGLSRLSTPEITVTAGTQTSTLPSEHKMNFGLSPRVGFMWGRFGVEFNYNLAGRTPKTVHQNVTTSDKAFNYYTIAVKYSHAFEF